MRPNLHPRLVNGRFGDPALFVEMLHRKGALLFDAGDLSTLSARDLLRVSHVFITHTHIDHFVGFDALLRVSVGREKRIEMVGPARFLDRLGHKLQGYEWDLVDRYDSDLVFEAKEIAADASCRAARFRFKNQFERETFGPWELSDGVVASGPGFEVRAQPLEHHGPCLGFTVAEPAHVNVWKNRVEERGLPIGPWLQTLKQAVLHGEDSVLITLPSGDPVPLGSLRDLVSVSRGQKIAYVSDVADTEANRHAIAELAIEADTLFLEARFAAEDAEQARQRAHLTTRACGEIARAARVRRLEPFHFSPRYEGEDARLMGEVEAAFGRALAP